MDKVIEILKDLHPEIDFNTCETLIDDGLFDSFDIVTTIAELSAEFDIEIPPQEIVATNFNSAKALYAMVQRLQD